MLGNHCIDYNFKLVTGRYKFSKMCKILQLFGYNYEIMLRTLMILGICFNQFRVKSQAKLQKLYNN